MVAFVTALPGAEACTANAANHPDVVLCHLLCVLTHTEHFVSSDDATLAAPTTFFGACFRSTSCLLCVPLVYVVALHIHELCLAVFP